MANQTSPAQQISLFRSLVENRIFNDATVRVLESILISRNVQMSIQVRSALKQFMRDESLLIFREITDDPVEIKLLCADFLIRVFAIIGDVESCLALRYEALVMREQNSTAHIGLQVTCHEWLTFAEHSLENEFQSIANQACEKAIMCSKAVHVAHPEMDDSFHDEHVVKKIKRLKDAAMLTMSSQSVRGQAAAYLKRKNMEQSSQQSMIASTQEQTSGSSLYKNGIKKHNLRKLHDYQRRIP